MSDFSAKVRFLTADSKQEIPVLNTNHVAVENGKKIVIVFQFDERYLYDFHIVTELNDEPLDTTFSASGWYSISVQINYPTGKDTLRLTVKTDMYPRGHDERGVAATYTSNFLIHDKTYEYVRTYR